MGLYIDKIQVAFMQKKSDSYANLLFSFALSFWRKSDTSFAFP